MPENANPEAHEESTNKGKNQDKKTPGLLFGIGVIVLLLIVAGGGVGGYLLHLSDTSPEFCGSCHIMQKNVTSYLTSSNLDNVHNQASVQCKGCHTYPIPAEISSGINYLIGNYTVGTDGELLPVAYDNDMCLRCHISYEHLGNSTDFLKQNPHRNHNGELPCKTCHVSHGEQIDYCSTCHPNGGQRMVGKPITPR